METPEEMETPPGTPSAFSCPECGGVRFNRRLAARARSLRQTFSAQRFAERVEAAGSQAYLLREALSKGEKAPLVASLGAAMDQA